MRRCKLISPTNLMLEHPILSPVDECEYFLFGVKEYRKDWLKAYATGVFLGVALGISTTIAILYLRGLLK